MFERIMVLVLLLGLAAPFPGTLAQQTKKAKKKAAPRATPAFSPTPAPSVSDDPLPTVTPGPSGAHKTFTWYFKNGCNCPQCKAFRQQQQEAEDRRKNLFQP